MRPAISFAFVLASLAACRREAIHDDFCASDAVALSAAIELYFRQVGSIPKASEGLKALVERPKDLDASANWSQVMQKLPVDPWGNQFDYVPDLDARPQRFVIISRGSDAIPSRDDREYRFSIEFAELGHRE